MIAMRKRLSLAGYWALLLAATLIFLFPMYWIVAMSFKSPIDIFAMPPKWLFTPQLDAYADLFFSAPSGQYLMNSAIVSSMAVVLSLSFGVPAAYALSRLQYAWRESALFAILCVRMIPPMSLGLPFFLVFLELKLIDTHLGLALVYLSVNLPLVIWMMKPFFDDVPVALEEAARIDGCSTFQAFRMVVLPLIPYAVAAVGIFCWIFSWNDFFFALILTRESAKTAPVGITYFIRFEDAKWATIAAGATIIAVPVVAFSIAVRKYLLTGLTAGAVKE
ncbi:MAG: carbohydrate ABC transporter permease [Dehalococcoidales bacterium]|nr:carbohydrate ABC transporter permease [Dehalococcoidales bacterium]